MGSSQKPRTANAKRPLRPARTAEEFENRLIMMAYQEAERQIESGTASATTINHFLKLGSSRDRIERTKLQAEAQLAQKRVEVLESAKLAEELASKAIEAFRTYSGNNHD